MEKGSGRLLYPRTPRDFAEIDRLVQCGASDAQIMRLLADPNWRSECVLHGKDLFCARCAQLIHYLRLCSECGLPLPDSAL